MCCLSIFLYEIDEDRRCSHFEYEYKAKYTNDQVIPRIELLKENVKRYKDVLIKILEVATTVFF
jgi:hypothetical protein